MNERAKKQRIWRAIDGVGLIVSRERANERVKAKERKEAREKRECYMYTPYTHTHTNVQIHNIRI